MHRLWSQNSRDLMSYRSHHSFRRRLDNFTKHSTQLTEYFIYKNRCFKSYIDRYYHLFVNYYYFVSDWKHCSNWCLVLTAIAANWSRLVEPALAARSFGLGLTWSRYSEVLVHKKGYYFFIFNVGFLVSISTFWRRSIILISTFLYCPCCCPPCCWFLWGDLL